MPAQAKQVVHIYKSKLDQSQFDFYVQAIEDTIEVTVDGQSNTDFVSQGTAMGSGWRVCFQQPIPAGTEVQVKFDARDFAPEPDPQPEPQPEPAPEPSPQDPPSDPAPSSDEPSQGGDAGTEPTAPETAAS